MNCWFGRDLTTSRPRPAWGRIGQPLKGGPWRGLRRMAPRIYHATILNSSHIDYVMECTLQFMQIFFLEPWGSVDFRVPAMLLTVVRAEGDL